MADEKEPPITAEDAAFALELGAAGLTNDGLIGRMEGDEARKLAQMLFGEEMPEDIARFFGFPEGEQDE